MTIEGVNAAKSEDASLEVTVGVASKLVLEGVAAMSEDLTSKLEGAIATKSEGAAAKSEGLTEGVTAELETKSDGAAALTSKLEGATAELETESKGAAAMSEDMATKLQAMLDSETDHTVMKEKLAVAATPERLMSPVSRVMELVEFGKKNLALTDTRFLSRLQMDLQEIISSSLSEDQKGNLL